MNTASLENCKKLYELSGWNGTDYLWRHHEPNNASILVLKEQQQADDYRFRNSPEASRFKQENKFFPAYNAGYLLRKLPNGVALDKASDGYGARRPPILGAPENPPYKGQIRFSADTPEDALALLAIKLIEEGILNGVN